MKLTLTQLATLAKLITGLYLTCHYLKLFENYFDMNFLMSE